MKKKTTYAQEIVRVGCVMGMPVVNIMNPKGAKMIKKIVVFTVIIVMLMPTLTNAKTLNARDGVNYYQGRRETYYNLPMRRVVGRADANGLGGWAWVRSDGVKMYGNYVIVAADYNRHPYGSIVETSLGAGIVLDTGEFIKIVQEDIIDIAVEW